MTDTHAPEVLRLEHALALLDRACAELDPVARVRAAEALLIASVGDPAPDQARLAEQVLAGEEHLRWHTATDT